MGHDRENRAAWLSKHILPHEGALRAWLHRKPRGGLDVDDVVQETYAILADRESVEGIRNPKAYAFEVAQSIILGHLRRGRIVSISTHPDLDAMGVVMDVPSPERQASDREELLNVAEMIAALPTRCREVFVLRRVDGLSQRDISQRLGISEHTVEKHMTKALRLLMDRFSYAGKEPSRASRPNRGQSIFGQIFRYASKDEKTKTFQTIGKPKK